MVGSAAELELVTGEEALVTTDAPPNDTYVELIAVVEAAIDLVVVARVEIDAVAEEAAAEETAAEETAAEEAAELTTEPGTAEDEAKVVATVLLTP